MDWCKMPELESIVEMLKNSFEEVKHVVPERILYASFSRKKSKVAGQIGPIPRRFAIFLEGYDYILQIHKESWESYDENMRLYLVFHELLHIPQGGFDAESKSFRKTLDHDIKDFKMLIKQYGVDLEKVEKLGKTVKST